MWAAGWAWGAVATAWAGDRYALLVAIGDYGYDPGWADLASGRDAELLQGVLERHAFAPERVTVVRDAAATKAGILGALGAVAGRVHPGDHVWFHYSGHGQQIADDSADEGDGYDEALVAYGAPVRGDAGYTGAAHLRDDELGAALDAIRRALGGSGSLVVTLDSCHSGTATRGELRSRGGAPPIGGPGPKVATSEGSDFLAPADRGGAQTDGGLAPMVVIAAAQANQPSKEVYGPDGQPVGALSLALAAALTDERPLRTWSGVFDRVRGQMAELALSQRPSLEGPGGLVLFDGEELRTPPYASVTSVGAGTVQLGAGLLAGMTPGSKVELHAAGALSPATESLIGAGEIVAATPTTATARLDLRGEPSVGALRAGRVFRTAEAAGGPAITVRLAIDGPRRAAWAAALAALPLVGVVEGAADLTLAADGADEVLRRADDAAPVARAPAARSPDVSELRASLQQLAYGALARSIELTGDAHALRVEIVPSTLTADGDCAPTGAPPLDGPLVVGDGDAFQVRLANVGSQPSHLTVLYVDGGGRVQQLQPQPGLPPEVLTPGRPLVVQCVAVSGEEREVVEQFKFFATRVPVDLGPVLGWARLASRGGASPLQQLLDQAGSGTRGLRPTAVVQEGYTAEITATVRARQEAP